MINLTLARHWHIHVCTGTGWGGDGDRLFGDLGTTFKSCKHQIQHISQSNCDKHWHNHKTVHEQPYKPLHTKPNKFYCLKLHMLKQFHILSQWKLTSNYRIFFFKGPFIEIKDPSCSRESNKPNQGLHTTEQTATRRLAPRQQQQKPT